MEVFVLMGQIDYEGDMFLGVYASEEEAWRARLAYTPVTRGEYMGFDQYYVHRRVLGAPAETDFDDRRYV